MGLLQEKYVVQAKFCLVSGVHGLRSWVNSCSKENMLARSTGGREGNILIPFGPFHNIISFLSCKNFSCVLSLLLSTYVLIIHSLIHDRLCSLVQFTSIPTVKHHLSQPHTVWVMEKLGKKHPIHWALLFKATILAAPNTVDPLLKGLFSQGIPDTCLAPWHVPVTFACSSSFACQQFKCWCFPGVWLYNSFKVTWPILMTPIIYKATISNLLNFKLQYSIP